MAVRSLQQRLFTFLIISLLIVSGAFWLAIAFSTSNHVNQQITSNLNVAEKVFLQLLQDREQQLINSALVLTDDFGFKQAVATNDSGTIESVLINHGNRIAADTIFLLDLSGKITATARKFESPPEITADTATEILEQGGAVDYLLIDSLIYQIVLVPVNAPTPIAIAAIGFKLDQKLADSLKDITQLNVSFIGRHQEKSITISSSGAFPGLAQQTNIESQKRNVFKRANFAYKKISLKQSDTWKLDAFLSVSMKSAFAEFDMLQIEVFAISIVAILITMIVGAKGTRMLSTPLRTLADTATRIAKGKFNEAIQTDRKISEISDLANAFDVMQKGLAEREAKIIFHSRHDSLTGLFTRQHAINELQTKIDNGSFHTIIVININIVRFKDTNDAFGHEVGDSCLKLIAQRINEFNENKILSARLGGD
ncbi:MAG: diguanylate cyclase [Pseudomonadales bacterium]|nr:diguanylate cyclase [Pseudomonadales bacterium]